MIKNADAFLIEQKLTIHAGLVYVKL